MFQNLFPPMLVQDRKTGQWYDPQQAFAAMMADPQVIKVMVSLKNR